MVSFSSLLLTVSAVVSVFARPAEMAVKRSITTSQTGTSDGYYYSFYTDGGGNVTYNNDGPGAYDVTWIDSGDFVAGVGWANGSARHIHYNASYLPDGNSYLSVYGWTTSPLIEYYITEALGTYNPGPSMTFRGTVYSDGSIYDIYNNTRTDEPSIIGTATFQQFWSIRRDERTAGTVRTGRHFERWRELGLVLGESFGYQILATEGYDSSGFSSVTVS